MTQALVTKVSELVDEHALKNVVSKMIDEAMKQGATSVEVGAQISQGISLTVRKQEVESLEFNRDKAVGLTVYKGHKKGSASTNDLSEEALSRTVGAALHLATYTEDDLYCGLADPNSMAQTLVDCDLYHPWSLSVEEMKALAKDTEHHALKGKGIENTEGASLSSGQSYHVYGNSHGFLGAYPTSRHSMNCVVIARDDVGMQRSYEYSSARNPKALWTAQRIGEEAARKTLAKLHARKVPTQSVPVLFDAKVASSLFGHFCSAISGSQLYRKSSFLLDSKMQRIFHPSIHISENPHIKQGVGSAPFDGDGVQTSRRDWVLDGVVQDYILSAYSARKLKLHNTGNAGGVRNLLVKPSDTTLEQLIKSQKRAFLVTELMGQGVNLVTGDYSRGATGFWIENGAIQFAVHEVTIAGNLKDMFQNISCICNDVDPRANIQTGSVFIESMMLAGS